MGNNGRETARTKQTNVFNFHDVNARSTSDLFTSRTCDSPRGCGFLNHKLVGLRKGKGQQRQTDGG